MVVGRNAPDDFALLLPLDFKFVNNAKKKYWEWDDFKLNLPSFTKQVLFYVWCFRILVAGLQAFIIDIIRRRDIVSGWFAVVDLRLPWSRSSDLFIALGSCCTLNTVGPLVTRTNHGRSSCPTESTFYCHYEDQSQRNRPTLNVQ